jgi:hypothetical protein
VSPYWFGPSLCHLLYITYYLIAASALLPALKRLKMIGRQ